MACPPEYSRRPTMDAQGAVIKIEKLVEGGWGLARRDAEVVLLRGVMPGETVSIEGETRRKGYSEARVGAILDASPDRVAPPCPVFGLCGGCQLQHVRYEAQDRKSTRLNSSHSQQSRMPSSA